jgi:MFS transporter, SHS family, lactate transporter
MSGYSRTASRIPWWREPTKDQWYAYCAAWMGWTLDAFDFTVFLLIMAPIAQEFGVPLIDVTAEMPSALAAARHCFACIRAMCVSPGSA